MPQPRRPQRPQQSHLGQRVEADGTSETVAVEPRLSGDVTNNNWLHRLPTLPYSLASLEPAIDRQTLKMHHAVHHRSYVKQLNQALVEYPALQKKSAQWLLLNLDMVPPEVRQEIKFNAGEHVNHCLFWRAMVPYSEGGSNPTGQLADAIVEEFGAIDFFKSLFTSTAVSLFGSGWVWLVRAQEDGGRLELITTQGPDNPMAQGYYPLLLCDLWEHAYCLQYKNSRLEYLQRWWDVVNWHEVERRYAEAENRTAALPQLSTVPKLLTELWRHAA